jgi:hypothetical protein
MLDVMCRLQQEEGYDNKLHVEGNQLWNSLVMMKNFTNKTNHITNMGSIWTNEEFYNSLDGILWTKKPLIKY